MDDNELPEFHADWEFHVVPEPMCDKCGKPVLHNEDATVLAAIAQRVPFLVLVYAPRHILCSPSRAQYIVHDGFPPVVDDRPEYDKRLLPKKERELSEAAFTEAWIYMQEDKDG